MKAFLQVVSRRFERLGFRLEEGRVEHYTVADDVHLVTLEDSGGNGAEHIFLSFKLKRMTGIRSALETSYYVIVRGQHVDNFTFAFVSPLES